MNAVIGNKYLDVFNNLDIEVSKKLEGQYDVEEIISAFSNYFFNKMFLDITSINDYKDISNLQKLSMNIDMSKVILFLDEDDAISKSDKFLSRLVSMGIYNFTSDKDGLMYLYDNPNSYRDVAHYQNIDNKVSDNIDEEETAISHVTASKKKIVLGIKNVTDHAGATTFAYLLNKALKNYLSTMVMEIDKRDLTFFNDTSTLSINDDELEDTINKYDGVDIFIVDLNKSKNDSLCTDILYLVEPSTIKLNKLFSINPDIFNELRDKKVIINKIILDNKNLKYFEEELNLKVFYNISYVNDKEDVSDIFIPLLVKLGYINNSTDTSSDEEHEEEKSKKSFFDFFKK